MSEENEKKQPSENNQRSGNRHRYGRHRHSGHNRQNQPPKEAQEQNGAQQKPEQKSNPQDRPPHGNQKNRPRRDPSTKNELRNDPKNEAEKDKKPQTADEQKQSQGGGKNRDHSRNRQGRSKRDGKPERSDFENMPTLLDTVPEDDAIFGRSQFAPKKIQTPTFTAEELDEIEKFTDEELFGTKHLFHPMNCSDEDAVEVVSIRFKKTGKSYFFDPAGNRLSVGDHAILDTARGLEYGEVSEANRTVSAKDIVQPLRQVVRPASREDDERHATNKRKEKDAFEICLQKIAAHKLDMKLVDAQYAFDNSKLLFYFTSAGRVDFRELVRDLASVFKTRIELRQIGIRDEAKMLGGIGICGRPLCCSRFLSNFAQVSIKMAKEQGLSLNSGKISGACGRLMCCLNFENQTYLDEIKKTPMPGSVVKVDGQTGVVTEATPLIGMLKVHLQGAPDGENVTVHRDSVTVIEKKGEPTDENEGSEE